MGIYVLKIVPSREFQTGLTTKMVKKREEIPQEYLGVSSRFS